ncbi:hypothetical protein [uncultured Sphingobacterium sp.]|uniref:hypothetical protein n=1 Tax=uncultured Sphingobacterium sp. TaxID=182688 RepID=UPI0025D00B10|nr:hypothetical protein [uncultured Sphingobacterium sp.]
MKKLIFLSFIISLIIVGCNSSLDSFENNTLNPNLSSNNDVIDGIQLVDKNTLSYSSLNSLKPLNSITTTYNTNNHKTTLSMFVKNSSQAITYTINFNNELWKLDQEDAILSTRSVINSKNLSLSDINSILSDLEIIFENNSLTASDQILYGISAAISSFSIAKRSKIDPTNNGCSIHPGFLVGKSYLGCQEDLIVSKIDINNILNEYESQFGNSQNISSIRNTLQSNSSMDISFKDIYSSINSTFNSSNTDCKKCILGCGSSHGCCGNYKGCCYYVHELCYIHDKICINCKPKWFCLPSCKPGELKLIKDPFTDIKDGEYKFPVYNSFIKYNYVTSYEFINDQNIQYSVYITEIDNKYYYFTFEGNKIIPDGYYFNNIDNYYYKVTNGSIVEIGAKTLICPDCLQPNITPEPFSIN